MSKWAPEGLLPSREADFIAKNRPGRTGCSKPLATGRASAHLAMGAGRRATGKFGAGYTVAGLFFGTNGAIVVWAWLFKHFRYFRDQGVGQIT